MPSPKFLRVVIDKIISRVKATLVDGDGTDVGTATNPIYVDGISGGTAPLPTGAATEATLAALNAKVTACNTGAVAVASSALPTGASTAALQTSGNASLTTIAGKDFATQTTLAAMNAKFVTGTDIGDVTINNGTGAAAVNIQDGGNSITVDGTVAVSSSALPTDAATETTLSAINTKLADGTIIGDVNAQIKGWNGLAWVVVRCDKATQALTTIEYEHHEIHSGDHYFVSGYEDLSINNVLQMTFQMPNTTKWIHWNWKIDTESETLWQVYEGGTINSALANAITPFNNNRNSANTSGTALRYERHANLAAANADVDISGALLLESGISGSGKDFGNDVRNQEIVLKQNTLYVLRATASTAGFIDFVMHWYEHTDA